MPRSGYTQDVVGRGEESFCQQQQLLLERIIGGAPLREVLEGIARLIERQPGARLCAVALLDGAAGVLRLGAAPSLPELGRVLAGAPVGPGAGAGGRAVYFGERVLLENITGEPAAAEERQALELGLCACWSSPIFSRTSELLGCVVTYYREPRRPSADELQWVAAATHLAAIAITHDRQQQALTTSEQRARQLARLYAVSSSVHEAITRLRDSDALYEHACKVAVAEGLARLAWVGVYDAVEDRVRAVARFGADHGYVDSILLSRKDERFNRGPAARVLDSGQWALSADIESDPGFFWKREALARGLRCCAVFPIRQRERTIGVFALYGERVDAFQAEELRVLDRLAADISFAAESAQVQAESRRLERAAFTQERLRELTFSSVVDVLFCLAVEAPGRFRIMAANPRFLMAVQRDESEVLGRLAEEVLPAEVLPATLARCAEAATSKSPVSWEVTFHHPSGVRHGEASVAPVLDAEERCTHLVGTVRDITHRRRAEAERHRMTQELHHTQRLQALGTLAGGIAHDFNNVLSAITGNVELGLMDAGPDHPAHESLREIQKASRRAIELVAQILAFSRRDTPERQVLDPRDVIREVARLLRATLPASVMIDLELAEDTPRILANGGQLHQVLMNLGTNGALALPAHKGVLHFASERLVFGEADQRPPDLPAGRYSVLRVSDTGCGMDEATLARMFEPFFTTRAKGQGTGLGLSVVHGIMQHHEGAVSVRSSVGQGSTFVLYFPAVEQRAVTQPVCRDSRAAGNGQHILYVDDEDALVHVASRGLSKAGYRVTTHSDARAALSDFRSRYADFDAVVTDLSMPGLTGTELVGELRRLRPDMPILLLSGYMYPDDVDRLRQLDVGEVMLKPHSLDELTHALARRLAPRTGRARPDGEAHAPSVK